MEGVPSKEISGRRGMAGGRVLSEGAGLLESSGGDVFLQLSHNHSGWGSFALSLGDHQCVIHMANVDASRNAPGQELSLTGH